MRDEERIEMYYKFGLLDWKNEQKLQKIEKRDSVKAYSIYSWQILGSLWARIIRRYKSIR